MAQDIFEIRTMGDALRSTGYKNIECAMAEIIDNSIQAEAKDILVIVSEKLNERTKKNNINDIAFLDNGSGMDYNEIASCLGIGFSTRQDRKGMGRFGVGLPQASLYATPCVEVYSWKNGIENCYKVFLDIDKISKGEQVAIEDPIRTSIPKKYEKYIKYKIADDNKEYDFSEKGTFVLWKNCDNVVPKTVNFLFKRLEFNLGRKFRYFISEGNSSIRLLNHENEETNYEIMPNDPLFLMENNYVLGNSSKPGDISPRDNKGFTETIFEPFHKRLPIECLRDDITNLFTIKYYDKNEDTVKEADIEITFSIVKKEFYDLTAIKKEPGNMPLGKFVKKLQGISIVRANREIDFGNFDFYEDVNQPQHRWWGCEIRFNPELDEAFGVSNNKQHVELFEVSDEDYYGEDVRPVWLQLQNYISNTIKSMYKENKEVRKSARTAEEVKSPTTDIINKAEEHDEYDTGFGEQETERYKITKSKEDLDNDTKVELEEQGVENPTDEDIQTFRNNKVNIKYAKGSQYGPVFDYSFVLGNILIKVNIDHSYYKNFLEGILDDNANKVAFELFIASFVRAIDKTNYSQNEQNEKLFGIWNEKLNKYIHEHQSFAKN